jgi:two-component system, sensor histidine kinase and response regulator
MHRLLNSLGFKIGITIILSEMLVLAVVGFIYINRFSDQVNRRVISQVQIPSNLMRAGLLSYNSVENRNTISQLVGENIIEALVVGVSRNVYFSPDSGDLGQPVASIPGVDSSLFDINIPRETVIFEGSNIISISPIFGSDGETLRMFLYIKAGTGEAEAEKMAMVSLFILGSLITVIFTSVIINLSFRYIFLTRLDNILIVLEKVKSGDLTTRTKEPILGDEIGTLQKRVNSMIAQLADVFHDLEQRVQERTAELAEANEEIRRFVYIVSHDLRTPLAIIQTSSDMLRHYGDRMPETRRQQSFQQINQQITHMAELIDNTLTISQTQTGKTELDLKPINLESFCRNILDQIEFTDTMKHQFEFVSHVPDKPTMIDGNLLHHILTNLLTNAVKYSPEKSQITFELRQNADQVIFEIRDEGIGIPEADQVRLFEPFHRASNVGEAQGTGLGLAIVKQYGKLHGGTIEVESAVGKGSTFRVFLPVY